MEKFIHHSGLDGFAGFIVGIAIILIAVIVLVIPFVLAYERWINRKKPRA